MKLTNMAAVLAAVALVAGGCGDGEDENASGGSGGAAQTQSSGGDRSPVDRVAAAMARTEKAGSFRMETVMTMSEEAGGMAEKGTFDATIDGSRSYAKVDFKQGSDAPMPMEIITVDDAAYVKSAQLTGSLPDGKEWLKTAQENETLSPTAFVEVLRDTGEAEEVGREEIDGQETVHVRSPLDLRKAAAKQGKGALATLVEQQPELVDRMKGTLDVWVGEGDDRMRRMAVKMGVDGKAILDMTADIVEEGVSLDKAKAPDPDTVVDQSAVLPGG